MERTSLQTDTLNLLRRTRQRVTVITTNGYQLKGRIEAFDTLTLLLEGEGGRQNLVYKHAVSTIYPASAEEVEER